MADLEVQEIEKIVADTILQVGGYDSIDTDKKLIEYDDLDSLDHVEIFIYIERACNVKIKDEMIPQLVQYPISGIAEFIHRELLKK